MPGRPQNDLILGALLFEFFDVWGDFDYQSRVRACQVCEEAISFAKGCG
jgi:hypothetical protein